MSLKIWRIAAVAMAAAALVGCGADFPPGQIGPTPGIRSPSPVEGTWKTQPFGRSAIAATLMAAGLGQHVDQFFQTDRTPEDLVISIRIDASQFTAYRENGGGVPTVNDRGTYTLERGTLLYRPNSGGVNTYTWSVSGDQLKLTFVSTTEPDYEGLPNDVFQRAFYTTASFHRA